jgi:hypothetical protein
LLFTGLGLNVICIVLLLRHYRRAPVFGVIGSLLYFPAPIAELAGQFTSQTPPTAIAYLEVIESIIAISVIVMGALLLREKPEAPAINLRKTAFAPATVFASAVCLAWLL